VALAPLFSRTKTIVCGRQSHRRQGRNLEQPHALERATPIRRLAAVGRPDGKLCWWRLKRSGRTGDSALTLLRHRPATWGQLAHPRVSWTSPNPGEPIRRRRFPSVILQKSSVKSRQYAVRILLRPRPCFAQRPKRGLSFEFETVDGARNGRARSASNNATGRAQC